MNEYYDYLFYLNEIELGRELITACKSGDLELLTHLLESPKLINKPDINYGQDAPLINACRHGRLDIAQYLLASPSLPKHANIKSKNGRAFTLACESGNLELVKYLLISKEIKEHADIHANGNDGLIHACIGGHVDIVRFLLTSPELKEHADVHFGLGTKDEAFLNACDHKQLAVVEYLVLDFNIEQTERIQLYLNNQNDTFNQHVAHMFRMRQLNKELNDNLSVENNGSKKAKI